ncbi:MAG: type II toxin-antitoxin system HicB family antitoxin [bacterium]|nr:type II toxin-antitoxin system HicB family antitoxin [bacterium]
MSTQQRKFNVHVILYSEYNIEIAHCLEFDIVAQGKTKMEAFKNLLDAIELQVNFAIENNNIESIFNPAPPEYWRMLVKAKRCPCKPKRKMPSFISTIDCNYAKELAYG